MEVGLIRLLIDFGLVVLIWLVQIVIYPSFCFMNKSDLQKWHLLYTKRITYIVLPLMVSQAIFVVYQTVTNFGALNLIALLIVISLWALTFFQAVPLHRAIDQNQEVALKCKELVQKNWIRTMLWSVLFILEIVHLKIIYHF